MSRAAIIIGILLVLSGSAFADRDGDQIGRIVGSNIIAHRVSGDWAIAFWAEFRATDGGAIMLLRRDARGWHKVRSEHSWTRAQLLSAGVPAADLEVLGWGDVPPELIASLGTEAHGQTPRGTAYIVATYGRSKFALTNGGDMHIGKQIVWQRIQEKWHPIFSYEGGRLDGPKRTSLFAKQGLSTYMMLLLTGDGQRGTLP